MCRGQPTEEPEVDGCANLWQVRGRPGAAARAHLREQRRGAEVRVAGAGDAADAAGRPGDLR